MKILPAICATLILLLSATLAEGALSPEEILVHVDNVRAPGPNFIFTVKADEIEKPGSAQHRFEVRVRDMTKSLVLYRQPVKQRGRVLLMDGPDMWIFIPGTSRALRISPQQQLVGGISNADVARVVFSLDYTAESVRQVVEQGKNILVLVLTSKGKSTQYRKITLYCSAEDYAPVRAEFFSLSGKLLRTAYYGDYQMVLGKMRPMSVKMISAVNKADNVLLSYTAMGVKDTPQSYYQPSYLMQLR
jgi:hypothetical protein